MHTEYRARCHSDAGKACKAAPRNSLSTAAEYAAWQALCWRISVIDRRGFRTHGVVVRIHNCNGSFRGATSLNCPIHIVLRRSERGCCHGLARDARQVSTIGARRCLPPKSACCTLISNFQCSHAYRCAKMNTPQPTPSGIPPAPRPASLALPAQRPLIPVNPAGAAGPLIPPSTTAQLQARRSRTPQSSPARLPSRAHQYLALPAGSCTHERGVRFSSFLAEHGLGALG